MSENRISPRHRVLKLGTLAFADGGGIDCMVRNISEGGARIEVDSPVGLPPSFTFLIKADHFQRHCHPVWRHDKRIGLAFD